MNIFHSCRYEVTQKGEIYKLSVKDAKLDDAGEYTLQIGDRPCKSNITIVPCKLNIKAGKQM